MKITKVSYQKTYSIGPYLTDRVGFEAEITQNPIPAEGVIEIETEGLVLSRLEKIADDWHKKQHPHLYQESKPDDYGFTQPPIGPILYTKESIVPTPQVIDYKQKETLEISIDNATSLEQLAEIKEACGKAGLISQYMAKLNQLVVK
jgi:hypothetical protein